MFMWKYFCYIFILHVSFTVFTLVNFGDYTPNLFDISLLLAVFKIKITTNDTIADIL